MAETKSPPRPREVTTAAVMGAMGSVLLVFILFDAKSRLRSVEVREHIAEQLSGERYSGLGMDTASLTDLLSLVILVVGALAAAAAVLSVFSVQRHRGARIGLTAVAAVQFFALFVLVDWVPLAIGGLFMGVTVSFAASMLWSQPARDWFAGRERAPAPPRSPATRNTGAWPPPTPGPDRPEATWSAPAGDPPEQAPPAPATYPFGQQRPKASEVPRQPAGPPPMAAPYAMADRRPATVTSAAVMTWVFAGLVGFAFSVVVLMLLVAQDTLLEAARQSPGFDELAVDSADLLSLFWVTSALVLFWSLAALVLAFLVVRRLTWAWGLLIGSAVMTTLLGLVTFPVGLIVAIPAAVSVGLLLSASARAWYARRPGPPPTGGRPPYGTPPTGGPPPGERGYPPPPGQQPPPPPPQQPQGKPPVW